MAERRAFEPLPAALAHPGSVDRTTAALLTAALAVAAVAASAPLWWRSDESPGAGFSLRIAAGLAFIAAGFIASRKPSGLRLGRLMIVAGLVFLIPNVGLGGSALLFTFGLLTGPAWQAIAAHVVVAFPEGRMRGRLERAIVATVYAWMVVHRPILVATKDPRDSGCDDCPRNLMLVSRDRGLSHVVGRVTSVVAVLLVLLVLATLARRWRLATRPERRVLVPVFVVFGANVVVAGAAETFDVLGLSTSALSYVQLVAIVLAPLSLLAGLLLSLLVRSRVGNLLVRVGRSATAAELERDIAWALGDPTTRLARWEPEAQAFTTLDGDRVELPGPGDAYTATVIEGTEGRLGALIHDASLPREHPELVQAVAAATRLALENQRLRDEVSLSREIPKRLVERLMRDGVRIGEPELVTITVLMADVRGYTTLAERADPSALARQLNDHRRAMSRVIADCGGTLMQFVGDQVFAVFGAPLPQDEHANAALRAALAIHEAQAGINEQWAQAGLPDFRLGIGLTTGQVAAVLLGSEEHVEYTVVGDVVNLAARLQELAGPGEIVMDEATHTDVTEPIEAEAVPPTTVKGRETPVRTHRIRHAATRIPAA